MPTYHDVSLARVHKMYNYLVMLSCDVFVYGSDSVLRYFIMSLYEFMVVRGGFKVHANDDPKKVYSEIRLNLGEVKKLAVEKDYSFLNDLMGIANAIRHEPEVSSHVKDFRNLLNNNDHKGVLDRLYDSGLLGFDDKLYKFLTSEEFSRILNKEEEGYKKDIKVFIHRVVFNMLDKGNSIDKVIEDCKKVNWDINIVNSAIVEYMRKG